MGRRRTNSLTRPIKRNILRFRLQRKHRLGSHDLRNHLLRYLLQAGHEQLRVGDIDRWLTNYAWITDSSLSPAGKMGAELVQEVRREAEMNQRKRKENQPPNNPPTRLITTRSKSREQQRVGQDERSQSGSRAPEPQPLPPQQNNPPQNSQSGSPEAGSISGNIVLDTDGAAVVGDGSSDETVVIPDIITSCHQAQNVANSPNSVPEQEPILIEDEAQPPPPQILRPPHVIYPYSAHVPRWEEDHVDAAGNIHHTSVPEQFHTQMGFINASALSGEQLEELRQRQGPGADRLRALQRGFSPVYMSQANCNANNYGHPNGVRQLGTNPIPAPSSTAMEQGSVSGVGSFHQFRPWLNNPPEPTAGQSSAQPSFPILRQILQSGQNNNGEPNYVPNIGPRPNPPPLTPAQISTIQQLVGSSHAPGVFQPQPQVSRPDVNTGDLGRARDLHADPRNPPSIPNPDKSIPANFSVNPEGEQGLTGADLTKVLSILSTIRTLEEVEKDMVKNGLGRRNAFLDHIFTQIRHTYVVELSKIVHGPNRIYQNAAAAQSGRTMKETMKNKPSSYWTANMLGKLGDVPQERIKIKMETAQKNIPCINVDD